MQYKFQAYGFTVHSDVMLANYMQYNSLDNKAVDVKIKYQAISEAGIESPTMKGLFFQVNPDEIWLHVADVARFLIEGGHSIFIDSLPNISTDVLSTFLYGPCMAALLMQRALLVLRGCVLHRDGHAIAFLGEGYSGKSSLMAGMLSHGYRLMSDELCVITKEGLALSGACHIELCLDVMQQLNITSKEEELVKPALKKYRLRLQNQFDNQTLPLSKIYVLNSHKDKVLHHRILRGSDKMNYLQKNIYNKLYLAGHKLNQLYFHYITQLATQVHMILLEFHPLNFNLQEIIKHVDGCI